VSERESDPLPTLRITKYRPIWTINRNAKERVHRLALMAVLHCSLGQYTFDGLGLSILDAQSVAPSLLAESLQQILKQTAKTRGLPAVMQLETCAFNSQFVDGSLRKGSA